MLGLRRPPFTGLGDRLGAWLNVFALALLRNESVLLEWQQPHKKGLSRAIAEAATSSARSRTWATTSIGSAAWAASASADRLASLSREKWQRFNRLDSSNPSIRTGYRRSAPDGSRSMQKPIVPGSRSGNSASVMVDDDDLFGCVQLGV